MLSANRSHVKWILPLVVAMALAGCAAEEPEEVVDDGPGSAEFIPLDRFQISQEARPGEPVDVGFNVSEDTDAIKIDLTLTNVGDAAAHVTVSARYAEDVVFEEEYDIPPTPDAVTRPEPEPATEAGPEAVEPVPGRPFYAVVVDEVIELEGDEFENEENRPFAATVQVETEDSVVSVIGWVSTTSQPVGFEEA